MHPRPATCLARLGRVRVLPPPLLHQRVIPTAKLSPFRYYVGGVTGARRFGTNNDFHPGEHQSPIIEKLWRARAAHPDKLSGTRPQEVVLTKAPSAARTSVTYPFSTSLPLREQYTNAFGFIRNGKILEDLDALAGNIAFEHCDDTDPDTMPHLLVTASVDRISVSHRANLKDDMILSGAVSWVGRSSMEIAMQVCSDWTDEPWLCANFTFVARNRLTGKAIAINHLQPETEHEKALFAAAATRASQRKQLRAAPSAENVVAEEINTLAHRLMEQAAPLRFMPCLPSPGNPLLIEKSSLENAFVCQPQQVNMHGRIFGGFLMRRAYELAFSTGYMFGGRAPKFVECDEVSFKAPVNTADLIRLISRVLYTQNFEDPNTPSTMHIEVVAMVMQPESTAAHVSNTFYFTFALPKAHSSQELRVVLPSTAEDARVVATRMVADRLQNSPSGSV